MSRARVLDRVAVLSRNCTLFNLLVLEKSVLRAHLLRWGGDRDDVRMLKGRQVGVVSIKKYQIICYQNIFDIFVVV